MKKNTLLYLILMVLVVMNGFFIYTFLNKPNQNPTRLKGNPTEFIAKELGFNEAQLDKLKILDDSHKRAMKRSDDELKELKDVLFGNLSNPTDRPSTIDSLTTLIGIIEKEKDMNVFKHLKSIQDLCTDNQKQRFQKIITEAMHRPKGQPGREGAPPPPMH
jgi:protein CpxP